MTPSATEQSQTIIRLARRLPGLEDAIYLDSAPGADAILFNLVGDTHYIRTRRIMGGFVPQEWTINDVRHSIPKQAAKNHNSLDDAIVLIINPRPRKVADLRCPSDTRKLFAKAILSLPLTADSSNNLIEIACQHCKRATGKLTFHRFDISGACIETLQGEDWIKEEPGNWWKTDRSDGKAHRPTTQTTS